MRTSEVSHGPEMLLFEFSVALAHLRLDPASYRLKMLGTADILEIVGIEILLLIREEESDVGNNTDLGDGGVLVVR